MAIPSRNAFTWNSWFPWSYIYRPYHLLYQTQAIFLYLYILFLSYVYLYQIAGQDNRLLFGFPHVNHFCGGRNSDWLEYKLEWVQKVSFFLLNRFTIHIQWKIYAAKLKIIHIIDILYKPHNLNFWLAISRKYNCFKLWLFLTIMFMSIFLLNFIWIDNDFFLWYMMIKV